ncbi:MAG: gamma-glutamyl-gamma-aminobutyrate hydrolase family protein [bacterium]
MLTVITNRPKELGWLDEKLNVISFGEFLDSREKADLIYFDGGEDVSPSLYGDKELPVTYSNYKRDLEEAKVYALAKTLDIPCLGVCRGSQFLTALQPGGKIVQDVTGHSLYELHKIKLLNEGKDIEVTSTHHQMMYPFDTKHELIAVSSRRLSLHYHFGNNKDLSKIYEFGEPEIVYYPDTKCLGIQGHPEYLRDINHEFPAYSRKIVQEKLLGR